MEYLFRNWDRIISEIKKSRHIFLFFDYDGTLSSIVTRPELAKIPTSLKNSIKKLESSSKFTVAIISGRSLNNIKKMVGIKGIIYAGNHGMEIDKKGIKFSMPSTIKTVRTVMKRICLSMSRELRYIKGAIVEDKGVSLSVHYRLVAQEDIPAVKSKFNRVAMPFVNSGKIKISSGKKVLEVRPNLDWDKGKAVKWLLGKRKKVLALYAGDDITDIDAFRAVKDRGISIFVGRPKRSITADYFLNGPKDVERLIEKLVDYAKIS